MLAIDDSLCMYKRLSCAATAAAKCSSCIVHVCVDPHLYSQMYAIPELIQPHRCVTPMLTMIMMMGSSDDWNQDTRGGMWPGCRRCSFRKCVGDAISSFQLASIFWEQLICALSLYTKSSEDVQNQYSLLEEQYIWYISMWSSLRRSRCDGGNLFLGWDARAICDQLYKRMSLAVVEMLFPFKLSHGKHCDCTVL